MWASRSGLGTGWHIVVVVDGLILIVEELGISFAQNAGSAFPSPLSHCQYHSLILQLFSQKKNLTQKEKKSEATANLFFILVCGKACEKHFFAKEKYRRNEIWSTGGKAEVIWGWIGTLLYESMGLWLDHRHLVLSSQSGFIPHFWYYGGVGFSLGNWGWGQCSHALPKSQ